MVQRSKRDRAILALGRLAPKTYRFANGVLSFDLRGRILDSGETSAGIALLPIEYALLAHADATHVRVRIRSEGGSLVQANRIYSALRRHRGHITTVADGQCASAATVILMAGDFRQASAGTRLLLHAPEISPAKPDQRWTADKHRRVSAFLKQWETTLVDLYAERTGRDATAFRAEIGTEQGMHIPRATSLGVIHCVEGMERWNAGRPYFHPDVAAFLAPWKSKMAATRRALDANPTTYNGVIFGAAALSKAADLLCQKRKSYG